MAWEAEASAGDAIAALQPSRAPSSTPVASPAEPKAEAVTQADRPIEPVAREAPGAPAAVQASASAIPRIAQDVGRSAIPRTGADETAITPASAGPIEAPSRGVVAPVAVLPGPASSPTPSAPDLPGWDVPASDGVAGPSRPDGDAPPASPPAASPEFARAMPPRMIRPAPKAGLRPALPPGEDAVPEALREPAEAELPSPRGAGLIAEMAALDLRPIVESVAWLFDGLGGPGDRPGGPGRITTSLIAAALAVAAVEAARGRRGRRGPAGKRPSGRSRVFSRYGLA